MNQRVTYFIVAVIAMTLGFLVARQWWPQSTPQSITDAARAAPNTDPVLSLPEFSLQNRDGQLQSIRSWPGKTLLINFWATWCAPCRREIPMLIEMQQKHAQEGLQVVGIAVDFRDDVLKYADQMRITYPLLIGEQDGLNAVDSFGIQAVGFPYSVFVDAQGNIITTYIGELQARQVEAALGIISRINSGAVALNAGRSEVNATLAQLKETVASE